MGPDIRKLLCDPLIPQSMNETEKETWELFANVVYNFLINSLQEYRGMCINCLWSQGCNMSLKVDFLYSHLDYLQETPETYSEEQCSIRISRTIGKRYQGLFGVHMMADYCWMLKRETRDTEYRKHSTRSIKNNTKIIL